MKKCPNCGAEVSDNAKFCFQCGAKIPDEIFCPHCGTSLPPNAKFCLACGGAVNVGNTDAQTSLDSAIELYGDEQYSRAIPMFSRLADQEPAAKKYLGYCYLYGKGIEENPSKALELLQQAAAEGCDEALSDIACIYMDDDYGLKDISKGIQYFKEAARYNDDCAISNLAEIYATGYHVNQDWDKSYEYLSRLDEIGVIEKSILALMYWDGKGVKQDKDKAFRLLEETGGGDLPISFEYDKEIIIKACLLNAAIHCENLTGSGNFEFGIEIYRFLSSEYNCKEAEEKLEAYRNEDSSVIHKYGDTYKSCNGCVYDETGSILTDVQPSFTIDGLPLSQVYGKNHEAEIIIPEGVCEIGEEAFYGCEYLEKIQFPSSLKIIGERALKGCSSLSEINLPPSLSRIGTEAFSRTGIAEICIPGKIKKLEDGVLCCCEQLKVVSLPDSINRICKEAFRGCSSLKSIRIPDSVLEIGDSAYQNCSHLSDVILPVSILNIGKYAFAGTGIERICIPERAEKVGEGAFAMCPHLSEISILTKTDNLDKDVFWQSDRIAKISVTDTDGRIDDIFGTSLPPLEKQLSVYIKNLNPQIWTSFLLKRYISFRQFDLFVPRTAISLYSEIFAKERLSFKLYSDENLIISGPELFFTETQCVHPEISAVQSNDKNLIVSRSELCCIEPQIGHPEISDAQSSQEQPCINTNLEEFDIEDCHIYIDCSGEMHFNGPIDTIPDLAFSFNQNIKKLVIPRGVTHIGIGAFRDCKKIETIEIPSTVRTIGGSAFDHCFLERENFKCPVWLKPENSEYWGISFFDKETPDGYLLDGTCLVGHRDISIKTVVVPDGVDRIGNYAFAHYESLEKITFPNTLQTLEAGAFSRCESLAEINWGNLENIGDYAFLECFGIHDIQLPDSLSTIGFSAFGDCRSLESIKFPAKVKATGNSSFKGCLMLKDVNLGSVERVENCTFERCESLHEIQIPSSVKEIGYRAFAESGLNKITLPSNVDCIESEAFFNCKSLREVCILCSIYCLSNDVFGGDQIDDVHIDWIQDKSHTELSAVFQGDYHRPFEEMENDDESEVEYTYDDILPYNISSVCSIENLFIKGGRPEEIIKFIEANTGGFRFYTSIYVEADLVKKCRKELSKKIKTTLQDLKSGLWYGEKNKLIPKFRTYDEIHMHYERMRATYGESLNFIREYSIKPYNF